MKYTEQALPEGYKLRVRHLHSGNSSRAERNGKPYVTTARIISRDGACVARGVARCSKHDAPSRSVGRAIAVGRAVKALSSEAVYD